MLKNSKFARLRKSRKFCMLAISGTERPFRIDTSHNGRFAVVDLVPHIAASETHERPENFQSSAKKGVFQHNRSAADLAQRTFDVRSSLNSEHLRTPRPNLPNSWQRHRPMGAAVSSWRTFVDQAGFTQGSSRGFRGQALRSGTGPTSATVPKISLSEFQMMIR